MMKSHRKANRTPETTDAQSGRRLRPPGSLLGGCFVFAVHCAIFSFGCAAPQANQLNVTSFRDPYFPEPQQLSFARCVYGQGRDRDRHIIAETVDDPATPNARPIRRLLHLQVFWQPRPGRTFADPSLTDATARYVIIGSEGIAVYTGTAFVYPRELSDGRLECRVESGTLRLDTVDGSPPATIGDARLEGLLVAALDQSGTIDMRRKLDLYAAGAYREQYTAAAARRDADAKPSNATIPAE